MTEQFFYGAAELMEAEFGAVDAFGEAFVVLLMADNEPVSVQGFPTKEAAKKYLAGEDQGLITFVG